MRLYRFDLTFSYWIFAWYLLFIAGLVKASPKLAILVGLIINTAMTIQFLFVGVPHTTIAIFFGLMLVMKLIPFWTLRRIPFSWEKDIPRFLALYLVYLIWIEINHINPVVLQKNMMQNFMSGRLSPKWAPGMTLIHDAILRKT